MTDQSSARDVIAKAMSNMYRELIDASWEADAEQVLAALRAAGYIIGTAEAAIRADQALIARIRELEKWEPVCARCGERGQPEGIHRCKGERT